MWCVCVCVSSNFITDVPTYWIPDLPTVKAPNPVCVCVGGGGGGCVPSHFTQLQHTHTILFKKNNIFFAIKDTCDDVSLLHYQITIQRKEKSNVHKIKMKH